MIYFDNGATSFPKPVSVTNAVRRSFYDYCANPGRGGYDLAMKAAEVIYDARVCAGELFNADPENVVFTPGCTYSLNAAIKGITGKYAHFIISDLEHNSVVRPLEKLRQARLCDYSVAEVVRDNNTTVNNFIEKFRPDTAAVICTLSSNVFGIIPPVREIARAAHKRHALFILDAAQGAGYLPIDMEKDGIDILCCAGHKGLYGPMGTGLMIFNGNVRLDTLTEGGTGSNSGEIMQPYTLPDRFESGTPNVHGIAGLGAGIKFAESIKPANILSHEYKIIKYIYSELSSVKNVILYNDFSNCNNLSPVLSFNIKAKHSEEVASLLADRGICVRGGLHCAPLAHKKFNTLDTGTVRVTPSWFSYDREAEFFVNCIKKIAK